MKWENFIKAGMRLPFYMYAYLEGIRDDSPRVLKGWKSKDWLVVVKNQLAEVYASPEEFSNFTNYIRENYSKKDFLQNYINGMKKADDELLDFCNSIYYKKYSDIKDSELERDLDQMFKLFKYKFGLYPYPKLFDTSIYDNLNIIFKNKEIGKEDYSDLIETPKISDFTADRTALLIIVDEVKKRSIEGLFKKTNNEIIEQTGRFYPDIYYQIEKYVRDFEWVPVSHHVQKMTLDHAIDAVRRTLEDNSYKEELLKLVNREKLVIEHQKKLEEKYSFDKNEMRVIEFMRELNYVNETRKAAMSKSVLWSYPMFQEVADRLKIDVVSLRQLNYYEIKKCLSKGEISGEFQDIINKRLEFYVARLDGDKLLELSGKEAEELINNELSKVDKSIKEFKGNIAQVGKVVGIARVIKIEYQADGLKEGEILVASMTDPDMVPAMKKAGAIVTDEGGITCHAAIVSRELGVPCIIGTKIATQVLKDGDRVEVDADMGIVRKLDN